jgi:hypothetical protein
VMSGYLSFLGLPKAGYIATGAVALALNMSAEEVPNNLLDEGSLSEHLVTASQDPAGFGFTDAGDVLGGRLGTYYPYFSNEEWESYLAGVEVEKLPNGVKDPPRRLYVVHGSSGEIACCFMAVGTGEGRYRGVALGFSNLRDEMAFLEKYGPKDAVLIVESTSRTLRFIDPLRPRDFQEFPAQQPETSTPDDTARK